MGGRAGGDRPRTAWLLALAVLAALVLGACTDSAEPTPRDTRPPAPPAPPSSEVIIGIDEPPAGFNPHTVADLYPFSPGIASLVLPSAFGQTQDGQWAMDANLLTSAEVTGTEPFTVTYRIRRDASWSDNAPIAAEDFSYLVERMRGQAGVAGSAGYQLVESVRASEGGKTVEVRFLRPYPQWRTLFRHLLPAHLLKDAPGGWDQALNDQVPLTGGPFKINRRDGVRREIELTRNDRYWGPPARPDRLIFRWGSTGDIVEGLRTGSLQVGMFSRPDAVTLRLLADAGLPAPVTVPEPVVTTVLLRPAAPPFDDDRVRRGVAAALDRPSLIATGTASGPSAALVADAQTIAPSQAGYRPTVPGAGAPYRGPDPGEVSRLLAEAGYRRGLSGWERDGAVLTINVAAPAGQPAYQSIASRVVAQLEAAGFAAELITPSPGQLFTDLATGTAPEATTPSNPPAPEPAAPEPLGPEPVPGQQDPPDDEVHVVVYGQPFEVDPATTAASNQACPIEAGGGPMNPGGGCDAALQPIIEQALNGTVSADDMLALVDAPLWQRSVAIPLYQRAALLVSTPVVDGVAAGPLFEGPLYTAPRWRMGRR